MSYSDPKSLSERIYLLFTGACMGAADIVPGVSGGTMAFIMGVYEDLLQAIKSFDLKLANNILRFKFREVFARVPWQFLLCLMIGLFGSVLLLAGMLHTAYEHHRVELYAFFFGLVLASIFLLARGVPWSLKRAGGLALGTFSGYLAVTAAPVEQLSSSFAVHFGCGAIAITAMILPGISGSFLLLILGKYDIAIRAVKELDLLTLLPFALGAVTGLLVFSRILSWVLDRFHHMTVAVLIGFMAGSLRKLYPWKEAVTVIVRDGETKVLEDRLLMPPLSADLVLPLILIAAGIAVIYGIELVRQKKVSA